MISSHKDIQQEKNSETTPSNQELKKFQKDLYEFECIAGLHPESSLSQSLSVFLNDVKNRLSPCTSKPVFNNFDNEKRFNSPR